MDYRLDTIALVVSQHYKLLKSIVTSSPDLRPPTPEEAKLADYLADVLQRVAGKRLADYCREKFQNGWMSRDLRSYKIKFVLTRLRDTLSKKNPAREELLERLDDLTDRAEYLADCVADNKRRNRKAREEQARKQAEKSATSDSSQQMDLFEYAATQSSEPAEKEAEEDVASMKDPGDIDFGFKIRGVDLDEPESEQPVTPAEEPIAKKGKRGRKPKKSARERKFERMTEEILTSEYGDKDADDEEADNEEPEYEYGKHFSDTATTYGCDDGDNW